MSSTAINRRSRTFTTPHDDDQAPNESKSRAGDRPTFDTFHETRDNIQVTVVRHANASITIATNITLDVVDVPRFDRLTSRIV